jgi:hypothetical protein
VVRQAPSQRKPGRRRIRVALEAFGRGAVESQAERYGLSPGDLVQLAAEHHLALQSSGRLVKDIPPFLRGRAAREALELEVTLAPETWEALEASAADQGVPVEQLLGHAALTLAGELDSGRVAARVVEN